MNIYHCFLLILGLTLSACIHAQLVPSRREDMLPQADSLFVQPVSSKYLDKVSNKTSQLNTKFDKQAARHLELWQKTEKEDPKYYYSLQS